MNDRQWQIGLCGTFDVENFGDMLFPLVAEAELKHRLGDVKLHAFSYHAKTPSDWPYTVTSLTQLPDMISRLDGLLIGGGFLIRFDKEVAPGYEPPNEAIHHPTGYWLTPALIALQHNVPVVWNAPGMHCNEIPAWAEPLMKTAFDSSRYAAVRDEPSQSALARFNDRIEVVPDTGFGVARLLDRKPSIEFRRLRESARLTDPYIIIQAALGLDEFARFVKDNTERLRGFQFLALPIGPVLGDSASIFGDDLPRVVRLPAWPHPLLTAELIKYSEAVTGHSYHLCITALACGVPVFTPQDLSAGKYTALQKFDTVYPLPKADEPDWFMERVGRKAPSSTVRATLDQLARHWDRIADTLRAGRCDTEPTLNRFWQSLPALLERAEAEKCIEESNKAEIAMQRNAAHHKPKQNMIDFERIARHRMETDPFRWAAIDELFSPQDAAALAASFPCDHFKLVAGYGGEKDYEYEARALIGLGADAISYEEELSEAWRALAGDLLSMDYRAALSKLTGCDLTRSPMEANVFHYGPGASLGPHPDLADKIVTHVLYFNQRWNREDGGCLSILRSSDPSDIVAEIAPLVGNSAVLVRSENSWHAVSRVVRAGCPSRRSLTVTFYREGSVSTMWPPGDTTPLHSYRADDLEIDRRNPTWARWRKKLASWMR